METTLPEGKSLREYFIKYVAFFRDLCYNILSIGMPSRACFYVRYTEKPNPAEYFRDIHTRGKPCKIPIIQYNQRKEGRA
jgi:hypothetical protein